MKIHENPAFALPQDPTQLKCSWQLTIRSLRQVRVLSWAWQVHQLTGTKNDFWIWLVDSIRAYTRVDVSGYPGNNGYPGSEEFGCIRVSGYQMVWPDSFSYWYISAGFGVFQQGACVMHCLRRFRTPRKNTPWNFGACTLCFLLIVVDFWTMLMSFCWF